MKKPEDNFPIGASECLRKRGTPGCSETCIVIPSMVDECVTE